MLTLVYFNLKGYPLIVTLIYLIYLGYPFMLKTDNSFLENLLLFMYVFFDSKNPHRVLHRQATEQVNAFVLFGKRTAMCLGDV